MLGRAALDSDLTSRVVLATARAHGSQSALQLITELGHLGIRHQTLVAAVFPLLDEAIGPGLGLGVVARVERCRHGLGRLLLGGSPACSLISFQLLEVLIGELRRGLWCWSQEVRPDTDVRSQWHVRPHDRVRLPALVARRSAFTDSFGATAISVRLTPGQLTREASATCAVVAAGQTQSFQGTAATQLLLQLL